MPTLAATDEFGLGETARRTYYYGTGEHVPPGPGARPRHTSGIQASSPPERYARTRFNYGSHRAETALHHRQAPEPPAPIRRKER